MNYYSHHIGDYRRDTMHLTLLEHGVYRQLLDLYYLNECELDANALRLICARSADEIQAAENMLNEFFEKTETGYKHKRCDDEIAKFHGKSAKAKASAEARWKPKDANAMRTHTESNANHKPITNNHKPINISFDDFWNHYDKKSDDKEKVKKKWESLTDQERELTMNHVAEYKISQPDKTFRKNPSTYLNQKGWTHEIIKGSGNERHQPSAVFGQPKPSKAQRVADTASRILARSTGERGKSGSGNSDDVHELISVN